MDVPLWSECRQRNVIRQRILIHHKKEITSALIWKKRAAIWINLNMYGDKINAVFASNHHAIHSKCYERYLNDAVLTALSAVYQILIYPNINQFEQPVSRRHLICSDIEIHQERCSAKSKSQRSAVVMASWYDSDGKVNLHTTASYIFGIVQYFLKHAYRTDVSDEPSVKYTDHLFANVMRLSLLRETPPPPGAKLGI